MVLREPQSTGCHKKHNVSRHSIIFILTNVYSGFSKISIKSSCTIERCLKKTNPPCYATSTLILRIFLLGTIIGTCAVVLREPQSTGCHKKHNVSRHSIIFILTNVYSGFSKISIKSSCTIERCLKKTNPPCYATSTLILRIFLLGTISIFKENAMKLMWMDNRKFYRYARKAGVADNKKVVFKKRCILVLRFVRSTQFNYFHYWRNDTELSSGELFSDISNGKFPIIRSYNLRLLLNDYRLDFLIKLGLIERRDLLPSYVKKNKKCNNNAKYYYVLTDKCESLFDGNWTRISRRDEKYIVETLKVKLPRIYRQMRDNLKEFGYVFTDEGTILSELKKKVCRKFSNKNAFVSDERVDRIAEASYMSALGYAELDDSVIRFTVCTDVDRWAGRFYSHYSQVSSVLRNYIVLKKDPSVPLVQLDFKTFQMHCLIYAMKKDFGMKDIGRFERHLRNEYSEKDVNDVLFIARQVMSSKVAFVCSEGNEGTRLEILNQFRDHLTDESNLADVYKTLTIMYQIMDKGRNDIDAPEDIQQARNDMKNKIFGAVYSEIETRLLLWKAIESLYPEFAEGLIKMKSTPKAEFKKRMKVKKEDWVENCYKQAPFLASLYEVRFFKGIWKHLINQKIPFVPIHDAVLVPKNVADDVEQFMKKESHDFFGYELQIDRKEMRGCRDD